METTYLIWAFSLGAIAAGSMVLGSIVGIFLDASLILVKTLDLSAAVKVSKAVAITSKRSTS